VEVRVAARPEAEGIRIVEDRVVGVAEVPCEAVEIAEDVARGARRLAVAGREVGVVEEAASVDDAGGLRIVERDVVDLDARRRVDDGNAVVEAGEDVQPAARWWRS